MWMPLKPGVFLETFENGAVGLLVGYAILMFSPILAAHERIAPVFSKELYRGMFRSLYWVLPKVAELIGAARDLIADTPLEVETVLVTSALFGAVVSPSR